MEIGLTLIQRVAICFAAGVIGGLAVVLEVARFIQAALLGRAVGYPLRALYKDCLDAALPLRSSILPRAAAGVVFNLPTDERRRVFRTSAGRADIHSLPAAGKSAVRNNHRFGRKGDNRDEAVSLLQLPEVYQFNILGFNHRLNAVITRRKTEPKKRSSMPWSGWPPCAPTSRTGGSRWSGTMGITVMSPGARLIKK